MLRQDYDLPPGIIAASEMMAFMKSHRYQVCSWIKPTLIFESQDAANLKPEQFLK